ncbi:MAG TPA: zinc ribbon domain-containing protein, partial [Pseudonocardiaceae bacterium]|nr:zinc ribbon domain-containing protein [Pseudonocardiaceae bacterium]
MTSANRPNYFQLLGIDPDDPWLGAALKTLLGTKRGEWSRTVLNGMKTSKAVQTAQAALDRFDDILVVMGDPILRERERADARVRLAGEREQRRANLERDLRIMQSKGFLWDAEVQALRRNYPELAGDRELLDRIDRLPKHPVAEQHVVPDQLESVTANGIRSGLGFIGERSLYTLLGTVDPRVDEHASREALYAAAKTLYQEIQRDMNRQDPRLNAKLELAGYAMQVFETEDQQRRYDNTLALTPVVELIAKYQSALASIKRIESNQVERFVSQASSAGVDKDVALAMLLKHFDALKWTVLLPAGGNAHQGQVHCEACQSWNDKENQFCVVCGTRLQVTCPSCGQAASGHGKCGNCGFPVGDHDWVALLVRQCEEALNQQDFATAEEKYQLAAGTWTSEGEDELAVRLRQAAALLAGLRERRATEDQNIARQLGVLTEQRNYHAALNKATSAPAGVADRERVIREATEHIREADRQCDLAKRAGTTPRQQAEHYTAALARCADHQRATTALSALPPDPAGDLRVKAVEGVVRLAWEPSDTDNIRYVIVRKPGTVAPNSVSDGSRIAVEYRTSYDDTAPEFGIPLHYAVYAQRKTGTASEQGAATTEPVFLTEE